MLGRGPGAATGGSGHTGGSDPAKRQRKPARSALADARTRHPPAYDLGVTRGKHGGFLVCAVWKTSHCPRLVLGIRQLEHQQARDAITNAIQNGNIEP